MWFSAFRRGQAACDAAGMFFLAEFYLPACAVLASVGRRARAGAAAASAAGVPVHFVQAVFVPAEETCFALFEASAPAAVTAAGAAAGLEFDRVTPALLIR
jgi:hypothetical protein